VLVAAEIAPEPTEHGLRLDKCEAYKNRVYDQSWTNPADRVEIITSVQRRRRWTASEKVRIVEETFEPGMTVSLVALWPEIGRGKSCQNTPYRVLTLAVAR
jgi:hypothetical protein